MMKIDAAFLRLHLDYSWWASQRSLAALRPVSEADLEKGMLSTLVHIYQGDRIWLSRLQGSPRFTLGDPGEVWTLDTLQEAWTQTADGFLAWVDKTGDFEANLNYRNLAGKEYSVPRWQVILHVVNHATYHRGQITTMLRQLGYTPTPTDLHLYYLTGR